MSVILPNLANCTVRYHVSTEQYLDQTTQNTLPNIVLIEVWANQIAPPIEAIDGSGFWIVDATNFNIGGSTQVSAITPTSSWATDPQYANFGTADGSVYNNVLVYPNPNNNPWGINTIGTNIVSGGTPLEETTGKWFTPESMSFAVDSDGNDISEQALANWDYRVNDIFICNNYSNTQQMVSGGDAWKNIVMVWVRLRDDWTFPAEDVTINIDIQGGQQWIDYAEFNSSDRRLKKNIKLIGKSLSGLNIYTFEYVDSEIGKGVYQGVMSDEIPRHAVIKDSNGYDMVNYSKIDVDFKRFNYG